MPTQGCKTLLDICDPNIYSRNAFRLLGMDVDQKSRRINRRMTELLAAIEVDDLADEYSDGFRPNPLPTREELPHASQALADVQQRFIHEFFWFWPLEWGKSAADEILNLCKANKIDEAQAQWKQIAANGNEASLIARHNLAVLGHWLALEQERKILASTDKDKLTKEHRERLNTLWRFAFKHWDHLCEDEEFWSFQANRIRELDDPRLTTGFLRRFSRSLPIAFDNINADMAVAYCDREMYTRAKDHVQIMKETNVGIDDVDASLRRVTTPLHSRIDHEIEQATPQFTHNNKQGKRRCNELLETVQSILSVIRTLLGKDSQEYTETCDRVAESMLHCQVAYVNETDDWAGCLPLLQAALKVCQGDKLSNKLEENIDIVKGNIESDLCWYCKKNTATYDDRHNVDMYGNVKRQHHFGGTNVTYSKLTIEIRRCSTCRDAHDRSTYTVAIAIAIGVIIGVIIGVAGGSATIGCWSVIICGVIGFALGAAIGGALMPSGIKSESSVEGHKSVREMRSKGWHIGEKPSSE